MDRKKVIALGSIVGVMVLFVLIIVALKDVPPWSAVKVDDIVFGLVLLFALPGGIFASGFLAYWRAWDKNKLLAQFCLWVGFIVAVVVFYFWFKLLFFPPPIFV